MKITWNPYEMLGVEMNASNDEIKSAFKREARKYHPDLNNGDDERFKKINISYQILTDPIQRQKYNEFINPTPQPQHSNIYGRYAMHINQDGSSWQDINLDDEPEPEPPPPDTVVQININLTQMENDIVTKEFTHEGVDYSCVLMRKSNEGGNRHARS